ncbi:MAG: ImmA/IrrE family metallo-endopeptidase [Oscillospiraceae bacterium]|jgi:hypothetical protein|nr:ImmA/IrrE family metallo-endopeptidase [Oscillospiraceae bacterium]
MTKYEIKQLFRKTRPAYLILGDDFTLDQLDPYVNIELAHLSYIRNKIQEYTHTKIKVIPCINTINGLPSYVQKVNDDLALFFVKSEDRFDERLAIAESLASIVFDFVPINISNILREDDNAVIFFAQKLLELYAKMDNGAILRQKYTLPVEKVEERIMTRRQNYDSNSLSEEQKNSIKAILCNIFNGYPNINNDDAVLNCEIKTITDYIQRKWRKALNDKSIELNIRVNNKGHGFTSPGGKLFCSKNFCDILHVSFSELENILNNTHRKDDALKILRLIIAHEFGHIVCHYKYMVFGFFPDEDTHTPEIEREATYFARLLLERREFLYNRKKDADYDDACMEWKKLIRFVYKDKGDDWLDWVLID